MPTTSTLTIPGHQNHPVPNEFLRQDPATDHLAALLPGFAYTCDMPLFYYAETLLLAAGADLLRVEYGYHRRPGYRNLPPSEQRAWLFDDATAALRTALSQRSYQNLTLVGKSLGTLAMGNLLSHPFLPLTIRAVWLTPLLDDDTLYRQIRAHHGPSLIAIGTADPAYNPSLLAVLQQQPNMEIVTIDRADHSLDIPADTPASVQAINEIVRALHALLSQ